MVRQPNMAATHDNSSPYTGFSLDCYIQKSLEKNHVKFQNFLCYTRLVDKSPQIMDLCKNYYRRGQSVAKIT